ncbi:D-alanine-D-alanine ligase [Kineosphaera limosa]|uniref:D-alanine--D-alanine ligase n=1 Tax=Kineosphaera limosa NBRC 100340 TaxID=1184609 RepID=K6XGQ1_9MICO|nr:D-alanine--D-alanine ligase family protein [Kineosphaera limosa]NYD99484.1 D-alanine-D-alanine ligase [Kineosphaera limosa]GAB98019.1 D-alanine--D-alanine ligase [Kineosphaera limosa NBRC 100340]
MSANQPRPRVAVVFGGRSSEHAVSCATAAGVMAAIDRTRYEVLPIGIAPNGRWVLFEDDLETLALKPGHVPQVIAGEAEVVLPLATGDHSLTSVRPGVAPVDLGDIDVVFPLLHGPFGEDGTIQGLLELADIPYVGSGVLASAVMMDKHYMKLVFAAAELPVGPYVVITDKQWLTDSDECEERVAALGWPVFVKPCRAGSSVGISRVSRPEELNLAIERAREHDPKVIVEAAIFGREIECGILQGRGTAPDRASELGEIVVSQDHEFYDFEAKYLAEADVRLSCPAQLPTPDTEWIKQMALTAFTAAGCEGLARVDFFYTTEGDVILNEINTMPGFTPTSMYPQMWAATGISYSDLITELIELARHRRLGLR